MKAETLLESAREFREKYIGTHFLWPETEVIKFAAEREALERERCCQVICVLCRSNKPTYRLRNANSSVKLWIHEPGKEVCQAAALRTCEKEGSRG